MNRIIPSVLQEPEPDRFTWSEFAAVFIILIAASLLANICYAALFTADKPDTKYQYQFEKIARNVANDYEYEVHVFDCSEFSQELYHRLVEDGYEHVRIEGGCMPDKNNSATADYDACHAWVVLRLGNEDIFIESIDGEVKREQYYRKRFPYINHIVKSSEVLQEWTSENKS